MFANLFFLLLVLVLTNFAPQTGGIAWISSPFFAFLWGIGLYFVFLGLVFIQTLFLARRTSTSFLIILTNIELLVFLGIYHSGLGSYRFLEILAPSFAQSLTAITSILFYLIGISWTHYWTAPLEIFHTTSPISHASRQAQFLLPFCLPFLSLIFISDFITLLPFSIHLEDSSPISWLINIFLIGLSLILMPVLVMTCWNCEPLEDPAITPRLEAICVQAKFKHAGIRTWGVMKHSFTAAIIGIIPHFRYVMFTKPVLREFSPQEIEAILIHEIGHSRYKHLLFYPFIFLGILIISFILFPLITTLLSEYIYLNKELGHFTYYSILFIIYACLLGLYLRIVFGFFSRLFERQADLHIFEYSTSPTYMISALNHIAVVTGYTHNQPNWHHFSIRERIQFLQAAFVHPSLIFAHHRKVKKWLSLYFIALAGCCVYIYF